MFLHLVASLGRVHMRMRTFKNRVLRLNVSGIISDTRENTYTWQAYRLLVLL